MVEAADRTVYGGAMTFPDLEATLARIDYLEGYRPERPERSLYLRRVQRVTLLRSEQTASAYCYVWRGSLPERAVPVTSGRWRPGNAR
jgi:gamma-glutamylcyclotransferase (GGCT)/AIG2-like uncharacterized protein YtfP